MLFADLLSLHLVTFLMFFILVSILRVHAIPTYRVYRPYNDEVHVYQQLVGNGRCYTKQKRIIDVEWIAA